MVLWISQVGFAQQLVSRTGIARFYSKTPLEDIAAENRQVLVVLDPAGRKIAVSMLLKGFLFKKELMQDHFNENYVESDKFPKAGFDGGWQESADLNNDGIYQVSVNGQLKLHGITRTISVPATLEVKAGLVHGSCQFYIVPEDFGISIPSLVREKIARQIAVQILFDCKKTGT
jgi:hypothetical protein